MYRGAVILGWLGRWARIKVGPSLPGKRMGPMGNSMSRCKLYCLLGFPVDKLLSLDSRGLFCFFFGGFILQRVIPTFATAACTIPTIHMILPSLWSDQETPLQRIHSVYLVYKHDLQLPQSVEISPKSQVSLSSLKMEKHMREI